MNQLSGNIGVDQRLNEKPATSPPGELEAFDREVASFKQMYEDLSKSQAGKFVAIHLGRVIDSGPDVVELTHRVEERIPNDFVLIRQVVPQYSDALNSPEE